LVFPLGSIATWLIVFSAAQNAGKVTAGRERLRDPQVWDTPLGCFWLPWLPLI